MSTDIAIRESAVPTRAAQLPAQRHTLAELMQLGAVLARSHYFADAKEEAQAVVKVLAGAELGISPIAAMTGIHIVKGKVTIGAHLIAGQVRRHPRYDYRFAQPLSDEACILEFLDVSGPEPVVLGVSSFTTEDAKRANLIRSDSAWQGHRRNMLFARAISNGAKWYCPDVFAGPVYTPDEMGAEVDYATGEVIEMPTESAPSAPRGAVAAPPARGLHPGGDAPATGAQRSPSATPGASAGAGNQGPAGNTRSPAGPSLSPGKQTFVSIMERLGIRNTHANRSLAIERLTKCGITSDDLTDEAKAKDAVEVLRAAFGLKRKASAVVPIPSEDPKRKGTSYDVTLSRVDDDTAAECTCEWFKLGGAGICKHVALAWRNLFLSWLSPEPISPEEAWTGLDISALADAADRAYAESAPDAAKRRKLPAGEPAPEPQAAA